MTPAPPACSYLATISVQVGTPIEVGETPEGFRRIIPITGGTVEGPRLRGKVLPAGADFQLLASPTVTELEAKYALETDDGDRLYVTNFGIRSGSPEDIARLVAGQPVDPERIYFRCTPRFVSSGPKWSWLSSHICIGSGVRLPDEVRLDIFTVD
jgi:hypothetical protein